MNLKTNQALKHSTMGDGPIRSISDSLEVFLQKV